jgi:hypothetical protein
MVKIPIVAISEIYNQCFSFSERFGKVSNENVRRENKIRP